MDGVRVLVPAILPIPPRVSLEYVRLLEELISETYAGGEITDKNDLWPVLDAASKHYAQEFPRCEECGGSARVCGPDCNYEARERGEA